MAKMMSQEQVALVDKIMEAEAYVEYLEDALKSHLAVDTREKYRSRLTTARKRLNRLETKFKESLENE